MTFFEQFKRDLIIVVLPVELFIAEGDGQGDLLHVPVLVDQVNAGHPVASAGGLPVAVINRRLAVVVGHPVEIRNGELIKQNIPQI